MEKAKKQDRRLIRATGKYQAELASILALISAVREAKATATRVADALPDSDAKAGALCVVSEFARLDEENRSGAMLFGWKYLRDAQMEVLIEGYEPAGFEKLGDSWCIAVEREVPLPGVDDPIPACFVAEVGGA